MATFVPLISAFPDRIFGQKSSFVTSILHFSKNQKNGFISEALTFESFLPRRIQKDSFFFSSSASLAKLETAIELSMDFSIQERNPVSKNLNFSLSHLIHFRNISLQILKSKILEGRTRSSQAPFRLGSSCPFSSLFSLYPLN